MNLEYIVTNCLSFDLLSVQISTSVTSLMCVLPTPPAPTRFAPIPVSVHLDIEEMDSLIVSTLMSALKHLAYAIVMLCVWIQKAAIRVNVWQDMKGMARTA